MILTIEPAIVERLHHSILRCQYDLQNEPLYQVKWYRGGYEFYRYTPNDTPSTRVFPVGGITIDVSIIVNNFHEKTIDLCMSSLQIDANVYAEILRENLYKIIKKNI